jgi:hypothetical protein
MAEEVALTWTELNAALMRLRTEEDVCRMIEEEMRAEFPRERWVLRMFSRLHRLRARREAAELRTKLKRRVA